MQVDLARWLEADGVDDLCAAVQDPEGDVPCSSEPADPAAGAAGCPRCT